MIKKYFIENLPPVQRQCGNRTVQYSINTGDYKIQHSHEDYWEFCIVTDGTVKNHVNNEIRTYSAGTLFYCTTKDVHYLTADDKQPTRHLNFPIAEKTLMQMLSPFSDGTIEKLYANTRSFSLNAEIISDVETTLHMLNLLPQNDFETINDALLTKIMFFVQLITSKIQKKETKHEPVWVQTLNKIRLSDAFLTFTVDDLCEKLHYSRAQLNRLFDARYGMSPHAYLLSNKLLYAQNLLNNSDLNTTEIANVIGYSNLAQFNISFKKQFGVTPGQYRKNKNFAPASI